MSALHEIPSATPDESEKKRLDTALLASHLSALRCLHSSMEHLLRSPLNSIGLNLELLAVEIADHAAGGPQVATEHVSLHAVHQALCTGYARLLHSTDTVLTAILAQTSQRVEVVDLADLCRRIADLGETESVLLHATWKTEIPPGPQNLETRRNLLVSALLGVICTVLAQAGDGSKITFSLRASKESLAIEVEVAPCQEPKGTAFSREARPDLLMLMGLLGGSHDASTQEGVFRLQLSLPRLFGAAEC